MSQQTQTHKLDRTEIVAGTSSLVIIALLLGYWIFQINGVLEMLELAYG
jgi:hypothetical protein